MEVGTEHPGLYDSKLHVLSIKLPLERTSHSSDDVIQVEWRAQEKNLGLGLFLDISI